MDTDFTKSTVYFLQANSLSPNELTFGKRQTEGTGFVVSSDGLIATCAHVIKGALIEGQVRLIFYDSLVPSAQRKVYTASLIQEYWREVNAEDVAIVQIQGNLPSQVKPLSIGSSFLPSGTICQTFGFPDVAPEDGMNGKCEIIGRSSQDSIPLLQLSSFQVSKGFSGAPVWHKESQSVVGMISSIVGPRKIRIGSTDISMLGDKSGRQIETAFATPSEVLQSSCPRLRSSTLCPYLGLKTFTEEDTRFFFGREQYIERLIERLRKSTRFLAVFGPSGSGKSSVIRAGLLPRLKQDATTEDNPWGSLCRVLSTIHYNSWLSQV